MVPLHSTNTQALIPQHLGQLYVKGAPNSLHFRVKLDAELLEEELKTKLEESFSEENDSGGVKNTETSTATTASLTSIFRGKTGNIILNSNCNEALEANTSNTDLRIWHNDPKESEFNWSILIDQRRIDVYMKRFFSIFDALDVYRYIQQTLNWLKHARTHAHSLQNWSVLIIQWTKIRSILSVVSIVTRVWGKVGLVCLGSWLV